MGYYTRYDLEYKLSEDSVYDKELEDFRHECIEKDIEIPPSLSINPRKLSEALYEYLDSDNACSYGRLTNFINGRADSCKWYDHEEDLKRVSERFPTVLFTLSGEGEESGDIWRKYFKDGKMQKCEAKITFDEFDEAKLK